MSAKQLSIVVVWLVAGLGIVATNDSLASTPDDLAIAVGDVDLNGVVDAADAAICAANQGAHNDHGDPTNEYCATGSYVTVLDGDVDRDGDVDATDLAIIEAHRGDHDATMAPLAGVDVTGCLDPSARRFAMFDGERQLVGWTGNGADVRRLWSGGSLPPTIEAQWLPDGVDLTYTYVNGSSIEEAHGTLAIGGFLFDGDVNVRTFEGDSAPTTVQLADWPEAVGSRASILTGFLYPRRKYAPVTTLEGEIDGVPYVIGVSVHYPVLEYLHNYNEVVEIYVSEAGDTPEAAACLQDPQGAGQSYWTLRISPNQGTEEWVRGQVQARATQTYRVSIRVLRADDLEGNEWLALFRPYRRYFKKLYGDVAYERDREPIRQFTLSSLAGCDDMERSVDWGVTVYPFDDPTGDVWTVVRDDLYGSELDHGFRRHVLWRPSGTFCPPYDAENMPYPFTSNWERIARHVTPEGEDWTMHDVIDSQDSLRLWANERGQDRGVGLWWGRSMEPAVPTPYAQTPHYWLPIEIHDFDPCDPDDVARGHVEIDGAGGIGATTIGLDFTNQVGSWHVYFWVRHLQGRHAYRYCTEPLQSDFVHTIAPNYLLFAELDGDGGEHELTHDRHLLMDFLNPCHETWAMIKREPGTSIPAASLVEAWMLTAASYGYTPLVSTNVEAPDLEAPMGAGVTRDDFLAGTPWTETVPAALRGACDCCDTPTGFDTRPMFGAHRALDHDG